MTIQNRLNLSFYLNCAYIGGPLHLFLSIMHHASTKQDVHIKRFRILASAHMMVLSNKVDEKVTTD